MTDPQLPLERLSKAAALKSLRLPELGNPLAASSCLPVATPEDGALSHGSTPGELYQSLLESASPPSMYPDAPAMMGSLSLDTPTPSKEVQRDLCLPAAVGAALPKDVITPGPSVARHSLRLPSFEALGIAAPHPDRKVTSPAEFSLLGAGPLSNPSDPLHVLSPRVGTSTTRSSLSHPDNPSAPDPGANRTQISQYVHTFTPPDDTGPVSWTSGYANVTTAGMESPAQSDPDRNTPNIASVGSSGTPSDLQQSFPVQQLSRLSTDSPIEGHWLGNAVQTLRMWNA